LESFLPATHKKEVKNVFREQMAGNIKTFEYYENPIVTKSGEARLIAFHNTVLVNPDGKITGVLFSGEDITEREKAKMSLLETQYHLSTIYNTVGDIIYYLKVEGKDKYKFVSVNEMFCNATGLTMDQVNGKFVHEVIPEPSLTHVLSNYKKAIKEKTIVRWEEVTPYPTGLKTGEVSIAPVYNSSGDCTYLVGSVHDITEKKKAEEEIKKLNAELEIRVMERTTELEKANKELEELNDVFVGREMRIIELKEEIERLKSKLNA
jgi:PAS domain S-box-containing protein